MNRQDLSYLLVDGYIKNNRKDLNTFPLDIIHLCWLFYYYDIYFVQPRGGECCLIDDDKKMAKYFGMKDNKHCSVLGSIEMSSISKKNITYSYKLKVRQCTEGSKQILCIGIVDAKLTNVNHPPMSNPHNKYYLYANGSGGLFSHQTGSTYDYYGDSYGSNDFISFYYNPYKLTLEFKKNGISQGIIHDIYQQTGFKYRLCVYLGKSEPSVVEIVDPFIDFKHLLKRDIVHLNNSYIRMINAVKEYHNEYLLPMQIQYDNDNGTGHVAISYEDDKNDNKNVPQLIMSETSPIIITQNEKLVLPKFGNDNVCTEIFKYGGVRLLDDFDYILRHHSKTVHSNINQLNIDELEGSLSHLYQLLLDVIKNKSFIHIDSSIIIRRCFRNRFKCEDERGLLDVYGKYNKNVINNDKHRITMQIMDKIYFYFAYTYNFGFKFDQKDDDQKDEKQIESNDCDEFDKELLKIKLILKKKKQQLLKSLHGEQIYKVLKDRKTKYLTSCNNKFSDDSKSKEEQQQIPGPSIKIFKNIKNRMQQYLIQMQAMCFSSSMSHPDFIKFVKALRIRSKKEEKLIGIKGISPDSWKAVINQFDTLLLTEQSFLGLTKRQFGNILRRILATGYIIKLYKILHEELQILQHERFYTENDCIEKCNSTEIIQLLQTVLKEIDKMDIENDLNVKKLNELFTKENIDGKKFYNLDEEYIICNLIKPCLFLKFDDIDAHRFGKRFRYWPAYQDNKTNDLLNGFYIHHWYVRPKYNDIKDELLNNTLCPITVNQWNRTVIYAAKFIIRTKSIKKLKAFVPQNQKRGGITSNSSYEKHGIKDGDRIRLEHLVPLLIYINLDFVAKQLLNTYNNNNINNDYGTWIKYMKYHSQLSHLARLVRESVECYGNKYSLSSSPTFYHLVDKSIHPSSLNTRFFSPTSVTTSLNATFILNNFNDNEIIYQLNCYQNSNLRYFNCSLLSDFPNEYEHIICGGLGCQTITNIYDLNQCINYQYYILAISMFIDTIQSKQISSNYDQKTILKIVASLNRIIQNKRESKVIFENYVEEMFEQMCKNMRYAQININYVLSSSLMKAVLFQNDNFCFDILNTMFPNINRYLIILNNINTDKQANIIFNDNIIKFLKNLNETNKGFKSIKFAFVDNNDIKSSQCFQTYKQKFIENGYNLNFFTFDNVTTLCVEYSKY